MKRLAALLLLIVPLAAHAAIPLPPDVDKAAAATVAFETGITSGVDDLVTHVCPGILKLGWVFLALAGTYAALKALTGATVEMLSAYHVVPLRLFVSFALVLFRVAIAAVMLQFYSVPLPGVSFSFHQLFPYIFQHLTSGITLTLLKEVLTDMNAAITFTPAPPMLGVTPGLVYLGVLLLIALSQLGITIITAFSWCALGLLTVVGPLMIPCYVLPGQESRFWNWISGLVTFSSYRFVGAVFIYVMCHPYLDFFRNTVHGNYSLGSWTAILPFLALLTFVFLFMMFKVPAISEWLFGNAGGIGQQFSNDVQRALIMALV